METFELRNDRMMARIAAFGAELRMLAVEGTDLLWTPDAGIWNGTCPVLFPVIGRVHDDVVRIDGTEYAMPMHGFALTSLFSVVEQTVEHCTLKMRATPETRLSYPYDFTLQLTYRLLSLGLQITTEIRNDGHVTLPASLGLHPGFRWPLAPDVPKGRHLLTFDEAAPIHYTRPIDRLIGPDRFELPLEGRSLRLDEALFEKGGLALPSLKSRSLRFHTENGNAAISLDFPDMDGVILWSRPGGDFLCIEPLLGHADPIGFAGDITEKPGMAHVAPGEALKLCVTITPELFPA